MTIEQRRLFHDGSIYWTRYIQVNGYAFRPNDKGLRALTKDLKLSISHVRKCINVYLEA